MALDLNTAAAWQGEETMIIYHTASVAKSGRKQIVNGVLRLSVCVSMSVPHESVRNYSPIFTNFFTDDHNGNGTDEFVRGENLKFISLRYYAYAQ